MSYIVDIHCHIDQFEKKEIEGFLKNKNYIVLGAATNYQSSKKLLDMKKVYPQLKISLGIHPEYPDHFNEYYKVEQLIEDNLEHISAIGEVGLPYFYLDKLSQSEREQVLAHSTSILERFIKLGKKYDLPLILHAVFDTAPIALQLLEKHRVKKALFHWFEGDCDSLEKIISNSYLISVSPDIMFNREYSKFVDSIPIENICLESDGPWEYNGERGNPGMIEELARYIGDRRGIAQDKILKISYENYRLLTGSR